MRFLVSCAKISCVIHPTQYQLETFINTKYDMLFQTWEETFNVDNDEKNVELA